MAELSFGGLLVIQLCLVVLAWAVLSLRLYVRFTKLGKKLILSDYFALAGGILLIGLCISSTLGSHWGGASMYDDGPDAPPWTTQLMASMWAYSTMYDTGLFFAKASLIAFFYSIVPPIFKWHRIALHSAAGIVALGLVTVFLIDMFYCMPISQEWSTDKDACSTWNSEITYQINFGINMGCDVIIFCIPFSLLPHLRTSREQKYGLIATFALGIITILIGVARYLYIKASGNSFGCTVVWSTAEVCGSVIVATLPILKPLLPKRSERATEGSSAASFIDCNTTSSPVRYSETTQVDRQKELDLNTWHENEFGPSNSHIH